MSELATTTTTTTTAASKTAAPVLPAGTTALTEDSIAQSLAQDRPTIDAAVKTYMIWVVARSLTASATDGDKFEDNITPAPKEAPQARLTATNTEALSYARTLLQAINKFQFNTDAKSTSNVAAVTSQLWNGLVESNQKPARFLGRIALRHAWDGVVVALPEPTGTTASKKEALFISEFGKLLKDYKPSSKGDDSNKDEKLFLKEEDSNAALIWDEPGAELERRRQRRQYRAEDAIKEEERQAKEAMTPRIEEITEEEEADLAAEEAEASNTTEASS